MEMILILMLTMLLGLMAIALFVRWYTAFCYRLIVFRDSRALDELLRTGEVPAPWRMRKLEQIAIKLRGTPGRLLRRRIMRRYAGRMRGMIRFVQGNRGILPEEGQMIARELRETADAWLKCSDLDELIGA